METNTVSVILNRDLEAKEVVLISKIAEKSIYCVQVSKNYGYPLDAKSILGMLSLGVRKGDVVVFGSTDTEVLNQLQVYITGLE